MARKLRIAALCTSVAVACVFLALGGAYFATRQVRPFYEHALDLEPEVLERGSRELESRASALYTDARQTGQWHALFTAEQINGWLATQLREEDAEISGNIRDPRVGIAPDVLTLGFRTTSGGVDTIVSVDASVFLMDDNAVGIRFMSVRAGSLPLPVLQLADEIATACEKLELPVRWTQQDGEPVAIVEIRSDGSTDKRQFFLDCIELGDGQLYVAGHTDTDAGNADRTPRQVSDRRNSVDREIALDDYELRLTPHDRRSALEVAKRSNDVGDGKKTSGR